MVNKYKLQKGVIIMDYQMAVTITGTETSKGVAGELFFNLNCIFFYDDEQYGNGFFLSIKSDDGRFEQGFDLRYDKTFKKTEKEKWLKEWAKNYWNGKNGAWAIKTLEIIKK